MSFLVDMPSDEDFATATSVHDRQKNVMTSSATSSSTKWRSSQSDDEHDLDADCKNNTLTLLQKQINETDLFIIDKSSGHDDKTVTSDVVSHVAQSENTSEIVSEDADVSDDIEKEDDHDDKKDVPENIYVVEKRKSSNKVTLASALDPGISHFESYFNMNGEKKSSKETVSDRAKKDIEIMKKSVITPDFERNSTIPAYEESLRQSKKQRKLEREKTKGNGWYGLPLLDKNSERKNDLLVLQMRQALNPKQFYKKMDTRALPKYCQFGKIVEDPVDFYSSRVPQKQRKKSLVDELLADVEFRKYNKRKYSEIQEAKRKATGPYKHMQRMKKMKNKNKKHRRH